MILLLTLLILCRVSFIINDNTTSEFSVENTTESLMNSTELLINNETTSIIIDTTTLTLNTSSVYVKCEDPTKHIGESIAGESGTDGVTVVRHFCADLTFKSAYFDWIRGDNVFTKCQEIPHLTAIATFLASGKKFGGDAAIFDSCDINNGVWIYSQTYSHPLERKLLPFTGDPVENAKYYYTVIPSDSIQL